GGRVRALRESDRHMIASHIRSNVVAYVALFIALGAGAYAAVPRNSVGSRQIKDGQVRTTDLADAAVTEPKLAADAVTGPKVADGSLAGADVADHLLAGADFGAASLPGTHVDASSLARVAGAAKAGY